MWVSPRGEIKESIHHDGYTNGYITKKYIQKIFKIQEKMKPENGRYGGKRGYIQGTGKNPGQA